MTPFLLLPHSAIVALSPSARDAFALLLAFYWDRGKLPTDETILAKICRRTLPNWRRMVPALRQMFDAKWRHPDVEAALAKRERQRQAARLGGLKKAANRRERLGQTCDKPLICNGATLPAAGSWTTVPLCPQCASKLLILYDGESADAKPAPATTISAGSAGQNEPKPLNPQQLPLLPADGAKAAADVSFPLESSPHTPLKDYPLVSFKKKKTKDKKEKENARETKKGGPVSKAAQTQQVANSQALAADFGEFWAAYPHQVGKADALRKYVIARRMVDQQTLLDAVARYVAAKPADRFWCNPGTWLHHGRWEDKPATTSAPVKLDPKRWVPPTDKNDPDYWENIVLTPVPPKESLPYGRRAA